MVAITNDVIQELMDSTAIAAVRFHFSTLTSGATYDGTTNWVDLGALDPASPSFDFNKEITDVMTGAPMTVKDRHITQLSGTMSAEVIEYNDQAFHATIGTTLDMTINSPMGWTDTDVAAGTSTRSHLFVTDVSGLSVGDVIAVELGDTAFSWYEAKRITAITPGTAPAGEVDVKGTFSEIPAVGATIKLVDNIKQVIGGNSLQDYQMRSVASFNNGDTMVIHAPKGNFTGAISPNYGDGATPVRIPLEFGLIGTADTTYTCPQVVLANHYSYYGQC